MKRRSVLIFSGYNPRAVLAFCRFATTNSIVFYIVARGEDDNILLSQYRENVIHVRNSQALTTDELLAVSKRIMKQGGAEELVVLPSAEFLNRFLLAKRELLEANGIVIPICNEGLYAQISDKYSFGKLCEKYGISVPAELTTPKKFPIVAKPKIYMSGANKPTKPVLIFTGQDYENFKNEFDLSDFYLQEFIGNKSYYLLYYFGKQGEVSVFSQENLIQQAEGMSIVAAKLSDVHLEDIAARFTNMFKQLAFTGLVMVEVKYFNSEYYMIEANPRLWGPSQLILDAGFDLFDRFATDWNLQADVVKRNVNPNARYFWLGGIAEDQKKKRSPVFHDYSEKYFFNDLASFMSYDIYKRGDSIHIFEHELKN